MGNSHLLDYNLRLNGGRRNISGIKLHSSGKSVRRPQGKEKEKKRHRHHAQEQPNTTKKSQRQSQVLHINPQEHLPIA